VKGAARYKRTQCVGEFIFANSIGLESMPAEEFAVPWIVVNGSGCIDFLNGRNGPCAATNNALEPARGAAD